MNEIIIAWQIYLNTVSDWKNLVNGIDPKITGCGLVYELSNPIYRPNESFAIADMSNLAFSEPHYHPETEIYFILQGRGLVVVGRQEIEVQKGSIVVIPSNIAHFTIPEKDLVMAVVNTPPFDINHYYPLAESNTVVKFDRKQLDKFIKKHYEDHV